MEAIKVSRIKDMVISRPFVPVQYNIVQYIKFWTGKSIHESKGGSFNEELYKRYL